MASVPVVPSVFLLSLVAIEADIWDSKCDAPLLRESGENARIYIMNSFLQSVHFGSKVPHLLFTGHALADTERPRSCLPLKAQPSSSTCQFKYSALSAPLAQLSFTVQQPNPTSFPPKLLSSTVPSAPVTRTRGCSLKYPHSLHY